MDIARWSLKNKKWGNKEKRGKKKKAVFFSMYSDVRSIYVALKE